MSMRLFTRAILAADIRTDTDLLRFINVVDDTIKRKSGVRALEDIVIKFINHGINDKTLIELFGALNIILPMVAKDSVQQNVMYKIRLAVIAKYGDGSNMHKKSLMSMRFDQEKWRENKAAYIKKVAERNESPTHYDFNKIYDVIQMLDSSTQIEDAIILLQLSSGARIGELLYKSDFIKADENNITQSGILKTDDNRTITKPVLFLHVNDFLSRFRAVRETLTNQGINSEASSRPLYLAIVRRIKKYFNVDTTSHTLRKIYGELSFKTYAKNQKQTAWVSRVLGHAAKSVQVSTSYMTVNIDNFDAAKVRPPIKYEEEHEEPIPPDDIPRNDKTKRDGLVMERLKATVEALQAAGIKPTLRTLKTYGYSSKTVNEYSKAKA